jgi:hypothetical protein
MSWQPGTEPSRAPIGYSPSRTKTTGTTTPSGVVVWPRVPFDPNTAPRTADAYERSAEMSATGQATGDPFWYGGANPAQRSAYNQKYFGSDTLPTIEDIQLANPFAQFGLGGGGSGPSASDTLAREKFEYEKQQASDAAEAARRRALAQYQGFSDYYTGGDWRNTYDDLRGQLGQMQTTGEGQIGSAYNTALANINAGYGDASKLTGSGYDALSAYLNQNTNNPFAGMAYSPQAMTDTSQQFMQAYGVADPSVQAQLASENQYNQQLGGGFNTLYDLLSRTSQQSQASRLAESQMARNIAMQNLLSAKGAYGAQAATTRQDALNDLINQISGKKFDISQAEGEKGTNIYETLLGMEDGVVEKKPVKSTASAAASYKPALQAIVNKIPTIKNQSLVKKIEAFAESNPEATKAQVAKAFPSLAGAKPAVKPKK